MNDWISVDTRLPYLFERVEILAYVKKYNETYTAKNCYRADGSVASRNGVVYPVGTWIEKLGNDYIALYGTVTHWR